MPERSTSVALLFALAAFIPALHAQNLTITYQNPAGLAVCGAAPFSVTLKNDQSAPLAGVTAKVELPAGVAYRPGSVNNATESNISNAGAPVFNLPDLPAGGTQTFSMILEAGCAAVVAINSGQIFSNTVTINFTGGSQQIVTLAYPVETGLLLIADVSPAVLSGEKGQVLTRTIRLRNTRQGAIPALYFTDAYKPGITVSLTAAVGSNPTDSTFAADLPGSFLANFGDGDTLFEFGEEVVLTEQISINDCGPVLIPSDIRVAWGCGGEICQSDSAVAAVNVIPSTRNPELAFYPVYTAPQNLCAEMPAVQELLIVNTGQAPAEYADISFRVLDSLLLGLDYTSFEVHSGAGWAPLPPSGGIQQPLPGCDAGDFYRFISVQTPAIAPGDTLRLRFQSFLCQGKCRSTFARFGGVFTYPKSCPEGDFVSGGFQYAPASLADTLPVAKVYYEIGNCLENNSVYTLDYWIRSDMLLQNSGFLQVDFSLPKGLYWEDSCFQSLGGKAPVAVEKTISPDSFTTVRLTFALPFSQDSVFSDLCLRYVCGPNMPCANLPGVPPRGSDYLVFPPELGCKGCDLQVSVQSHFLPAPDADINCAVSACDVFTLVVDDVCGGGSSIPGLPSVVSLNYEAYRLNLGLRDDNDDRLADGNAPPTLSQIRRDRFLTGDTLRTELNATVLDGPLTRIDFRQFHESWASDFGVAGADTFFLPATKTGFMNADTTVFIGGRLILNIAATGQQYECPLPGPAEKSDLHLFTIADVNIRPYLVLDEVASMFHQFNVVVTGCLPAGTAALQTGDRMTIVADYKLQKNFVPPADVLPPLVNFRSAVCTPAYAYAWKQPFCIPPKLLQYSGHILDIAEPRYAIRPCENADMLSPFSYSLRIARGNMFPFEVRPLATVLDYYQRLPQGVPLLNVRLPFLRLQENKVLFGEQLLNPVFQDDRFRPDLSPFFSQPLDEGFSWQIQSEFGPFCDYSNNGAANTGLTVRYANECFHWPEVADYLFPNFSGYQNGTPKVLLAPPGIAVDLQQHTVALNLALANLANYPAPNTWLSVDDQGALDNAALLYMPSGQIVPRLGGLWQIGTWPSGDPGKQYLQLNALNRSCGPVDLRFRYGWDCEPVANPDSDLCGRYDTLLELRPQLPELELVVENEPSPVPMCAPSDWFEFLVYNANTGYAYGLAPSVKLPPGLRIVSGSSQMAYPDGGLFLALPDPLGLPGNVYEWNPQAASQVLAQSGLAGFDQEPFNALRIRFRVEALCGAVSNAQIIYQVAGRLPCGIASNTLRKPGDPVLIGDLAPSYGVSAQIGFADPPGRLACGGTTVLEVTLASSDAPSPGDSIYVLLPEGVSYVSGSYQPGPNAPAEGPLVTGKTLRWALPAGLGIGATLRFRFSIRYDDAAGCADQVVALQTREQAQAFCPAIGASCDVFVATGETFLPLNLQNPQLTLRNFEPEFQNNKLEFSALLENAGAGAANNPVVQFYLDQNQNGQVDAGDTLVRTVQVDQTLTPGAIAGISGALNISAADLCRLLAFVPGAENCACADQTIPLGGNVFTTTAIGLCEILPVPVGVDSTAGHLYEWLTPKGLNCANCAQAIFMPDSGLTLTTLILRETAGDCLIEHRFELRVGGVIGLETPDQTLCRGETVRLEATPGGTYQWSGPNIGDPALRVQVVQPATTATYSVTVTFAGGCTGAGAVQVTVLESDSVDLGVVSTCAGKPVLIFGALTGTEGLYTQTLPKSNGCDSVLFVRLYVTPALTAENRPLCPGDSTWVFDSLFTQPGNLCRDYVTPDGCDSTHCVYVKAVPGPSLPVPDTVILEIGREIQLNAPDGFAVYEWSPPGDLSCADCPDPVAKPGGSSTYRLTVTDGNGCTATVEYRVLLFPPCDPQRLIIPNAFTPDGDGNNDVFKVVPFEGFEQIVSLQIYNRWGQRIYLGSGPAAAWDGTAGGKPAPSDVYVYILEADCGGTAGRLVGDVTLLR